MDEDELAAATMRTLARLVRATAHEVRGASSAVAIHAELLSTTVESVEDQELRQRQRRYLDVLDDERRRLQRIIEAFFSHVALPDAASTVFRPLDLVSDAVELVRPYAVSRQMTLTVQRDGTDVVAKGRRSFLRLALLDILADVIDHGAPGGAVLVSVERAPGVVRLAIGGLEGSGPLPEGVTARWTGVVDRAGGTVRARAGAVDVDLPEAPRVDD